MATFEPTAPLSNLRRRAAILKRIREFFEAQQVLEVETPALSRAGVTDPNLAPFTTRYVGPGSEPGGATLYLQTSPEYAMKRLLAAGSGPIFQISKAFRNGEAGRFHNPEFTLLEWYRPGFDHHELMEEVDALVRRAIGDTLTLRATRHLSYRDAFQGELEIDPHTHATEGLVSLAREHSGVDLALEPRLSQRDAALDLLLTHRVEASFLPDQPTFLTDYPASQAALARTREVDGSLVAERFELYLGGTELANGFHELTDATEQRRRFEQERHIRRDRDLPDIPLDERLLAALEHGLPSCAGVALGLDRLVQVAIAAERLEEVIAFPIEHA